MPKMAELIRVVLGDDNALVLAGLRSLLEAETDLRVVESAMDGERLRQAVERCHPDVAVIEVNMPVVDGLSCLRHIRRVSPQTKVLMLTAYADGQTLHTVIRAGADGLLLKSDPPGQTIQGVREVMAGALVLPAAARQWLGGGPRTHRFDPLSERESEVLALVAQGLGNRQVAEKLFVSENTVKFHLQNVFQRLAVANRTEASRWFLRNQEAPAPADLPARLRVLVVEDEALVAEEIRDRLERLMVDVVAVADSGEQAIRMVDETRPDLVLMDIRLKGALDGIQAAALIRERHDVPVVYLTAHSDPSTLDRAMRGAPFGYVLKPFQEKDLRIAIASAMSRARSEQALEERNALYAAMLASIADAVVAVDTLGLISFLNAAAEAITGWTRDEAMGKPAPDVLRMIDEATREEMESPAVRALRQCTAEQATHDALLIDRQGATIPMASSAAPVFDARGRLSGAVMVMRDLRERRRLQEALRTAKGRLLRTQRLPAVAPVPPRRSV
jgi:PAS domain S-box-containing protein